ncbi:MAG: M48 family metalloprotease [Myxococcales bacterium]|nr:M48 family metalloprotease [Myxococcales bacterium]
MRRALALLLLGVTVLSSACAWNPATRRLDFNLLSDADEIELGRRGDVEVVSAAGIYDDDPLEAMVTEVGARLAAQSERPGLSWTFRTLDAPEVNAFALPGGFVYVTRGLLAHLEDEAELAAVLGHEIGHVTGRHGVTQYSRARVASRSVGFFRIFDPELRHVGAVAGVTAGLALLKHSRADEEEADRLALRYLARGGYPPAAMSDVLGLLVFLARAQGEAGLPILLSSHPDPGDRQALIDRELARRGLATSARRQDPDFLARLDGLVIGDDPRLGLVIDGHTLVRASAGYALDLPEGWKIERDRTMAMASDPGEKLLFIVGPASGDDLDAVERAFLDNPKVRAGPRWTGTIPEIEARGGAFDLVSGDTWLSGIVVFADLGGTILVMMLAGEHAEFGAHGASLEHHLSTLRRLDPATRASITPDRLALARPAVPTRLDALASDPDEVALVGRLNRRAPTEMIGPGTTVKVVRRGQRPAGAEPREAAGDPG